MEILIGVTGAAAAVFVAIFGGRGVVDLVRERRRARSSVDAAAPAPAPASFKLRQDIRFATTPDGVRIAYSVAGHGPPMVKMGARITHLEYDWDSPVFGPLWAELVREHTLIRFDARGCGLSDWQVEDISFEGFLTDLETVVDALELETFALFGQSQSGPVAVEYAAAHPERVSHLVLHGTFARGRLARGKQAADEGDAMATLILNNWGKDNPAYRQIYTTRQLPGATAEQRRWLDDRERVAATAENVVRHIQASRAVDVTERAKSVTVPTLVIHSREDGAVSFEEGRLLASSIPGARFVALEGANHFVLEGEPAWDTFVSELNDFLASSE